MRIRRTYWKGRWIPFISFYITDDYGDEIQIRVKHRDVCPVYHFLSQTYI